MGIFVGRVCVIHVLALPFVDFTEMLFLGSQADAENGPHSGVQSSLRDEEKP